MFIVFFFGQTINIYVMHYQTEITMYFVPGIMGFFLVGMKLCQGGIAADASSVQGQSTYQGSFVNEKGEFLNRGKLRKIIAVVDSHTPHSKEKWHPRQQEILLQKQTCCKSIHAYIRSHFCSQTT